MSARLGRYTVLQHLASGGMADLLLGRADGIEGFARHVVLKRIRPEYARDQRFIRMFLDEARVVAGLHCQQIVQVHDIGEADGEYFFAMEYLHGEDVRALLSLASKTRTHVPLPISLAIASAAAAGLHHAHERRGPDKRSLGIVHRDVSPSNIRVGYDGAIKLLDFGIAKAAASEDTRPGVLKGKIAYMSPEQCKGEDIDRRSDIYSLGAVLYELATTSRLFRGDSDYQLLDQIVHGRITPPDARRPELPGELVAIILRAIAPDPEQRYATADELRADLDQLVDQLGIATPSQITAYMRAQFGDKSEPWLELDGQFADSFDDDVATVAAPRRTWTEMPIRASTRPRSTSPFPRADLAVPVGSPERAAPPNTMHVPRIGIDWSPLIKTAVIGVPVLAILLVIAIWKLAANGATELAPPEVAVIPTAPAQVVEPPAPPPAPAAAEPERTPEPRTAAPAPPPPRTRSVAAKRSSVPPVAKQLVNELAEEPTPRALEVAPAPAPPPPVAVVAVAATVAPPAPVAPARPRSVTPRALEANQIGGERSIVPDAVTQAAIARAGVDQIAGTYKLCVAETGAVTSVSQLKSSGFAAYDSEIATTIREQWRYRPFVVDGKPAAVCSAIRFVYSQK